MVAIHNKQGAAGIINDMVTGDMQVAFLNVASTAAQIKAGKLRPMAVVNPKWLPDYPDVPTMKRSAIPMSAPSPGRACSRRRPRPATCSKRCTAPLLRR